MDEIEKLEKELAESKEKIAALEKENTEFKDSNTKLDGDLKAKDATIEDMKRHNAEQAQNFKKLRDMTVEEKAKYNEKEIEIMKRQEEIEEKAAKFKEEQDVFTKKQREAMIESLATKKAAGDADLKEKIKVNLGKLKDSELAVTEQDLSAHIDSAFNMLGISNAPDPLNEAHNFTGKTGEYKPENSFAETAEGKAALQAMGLAPEVTNDKK